MDTPLDKLTEEFRRLPGIGVKTARKLAYYIVQQPASRVDEFVDAIRDAKANMHFCSVCFNLSSQDPCPICSDISRDRSTICVVETPQDVQAIERSGDYHGLYHVLHGALSPLDGVNVEDLRLEHSPGAQFGLAEISVTPSVVRQAEDGLVARGWKIASLPA